MKFILWTAPYRGSSGFTTATCVNKWTQQFITSFSWQTTLVLPLKNWHFHSSCRTTELHRSKKPVNLEENRWDLPSKSFDFSSERRYYRYYFMAQAFVIVVVVYCAFVSDLCPLSLPLCYLFALILLLSLKRKYLITWNLPHYFQDFLAPVAPGNGHKTFWSSFSNFSARSIVFIFPVISNTIWFVHSSPVIKMDDDLQILTLPYNNDLYTIYNKTNNIKVFVLLLFHISVIVRCTIFPCNFPHINFMLKYLP